MPHNSMTNWPDVEQELRLSKNRFRTFADFSYDWEEWLLPDQTLEYISPACERITGYPVDEFIRNPGFTSTIVHPEDRECYLLHIMSELQSSRTKAEITFRILTKEEEVRWIWHQCQPVFSSNGTWLGRRITNRDITALKEAEKKLKDHYQLFESGPAVIFKWQAEPGWPVEYVSSNVREMFGYKPEDFVDDRIPFSATIHPEDLARVGDEVRFYSSQADRSTFEQRYRCIDAAGKIRWIYDKINILRAANGDITHYQGYLLDITHQIEREKTLKKSGARLSLALAMADLGYWNWNLEQKRLFLSEELCDIFGLERTLRAQFTLKKMLKLVIPVDQGKVVSFFKQMADVKQDIIEFKIQHSNGHHILLRAKYDDMYDDCGNIVGREGVCQDITSIRQVENNLLISNLVFEQTKEGILVADREGIIRQINPAVSRITGYEAAEVLGKTPRLFKSDRHSREFYETMWWELLAKGCWQGEIWNRRKNGEIYPEWLSITAVKDAAGTVTEFIAVFHDMTEIKQKEEAILHQAHHDSLTDLSNRTLLLDRLKVFLRLARRSGKKVAILFIDLDHFKHINDSLGHTLGDMLLRQAADRLRQCARAEDTVARHGGDEFVIVQGCLTDSDIAVKTAKRVINAFHSSFEILGHELFVTASIGISCFPDDGEKEDLLISNADLAMYQAKKQGRNGYSQFTRGLNEKANRRLSLENSLRHALENTEFIIYYQPKVSLKEKRIIGFEALVRWQPDPGTIISPLEFIPLAEETGLIVPIGKFVLENACRQAMIWQEAGLSLSVAVNLSTVQFRQKDFLASIQSIVSASGLDPHFLELEITESLMMGNEAIVVGYLWELKKMGIKLSVDDFGTGYSSLAYLKQLPIDSLKIDRSFVKELPDNKEDAVIASTIISMAGNLGLTAIAEGVETPEQCNFFMEMGCHQIQGYLVSPPVSASELKKLLESSLSCFLM